MPTSVEFPRRVQAHGRPRRSSWVWLVPLAFWATSTSVPAWTIGAARGVFSSSTPSFAGSPGLCLLAGPKFRKDSADGRERGDACNQVLADYSAQASRLFDNMRVPSALLIGCVMPLGFFASPQVQKDDTATVKTLKHLHHLLAALAVACLLTTVVWSTIMVNRLVEGAVEPTASVVELLMRDYFLQWIGCNVNFLVGLLCFASTLVTYSLVSFGAARNAVTSLVTGALCMMISIVNQQVRLGAGSELRFKNIPGLLLTYWGLLFKEVKVGSNPLMAVACVLFIASFWLMGKLVYRTAKADK